MPGVLERLNLGSRLFAIPGREKNVVVGVGVERRIEINEVYRLVFDVPAENIEIVPVEEQVVGQIVPPYTEDLATGRPCDPSLRPG